MIIKFISQAPKKFLFGAVSSEDSIASQMLSLSRKQTAQQMKQELRELGYIIHQDQRYSIQKAPIILLRHGFSDSNYVYLKVRQSDEETKLLIQQDICLMDPSLHLAGLVQIQKQAEQFKFIPFDIVFVSPLRRAIQSALQLFKDHPQKSQIAFIVVPELCEIIGYPTDFQMETQKVVQEFKLAFQQEEMSINFDLYTQITENCEISDFWQWNIAQNMVKKQIFIDSYKKTLDEIQVTFAEKQQFLMDLYDLNPEGILETLDDVYHRAQVAKSIIIQYLQEQNRFKPTDVDERVAIVSHLRLIQSLSVFEGGAKRFSLKNGEGAPYTWEDLES